MKRKRLRARFSRERTQSQPVEDTTLNKNPTMASNGGSAPLHPTDETKCLMVNVTAPANLEAGYTFEAEINGDPTKIFTCAVPEGGVVEGQTFLAPLPLSYNGPRVRAPIGMWKDGVFDCCSVGFFHPSLWCSWCCTQFAMGQLMTRMQLNWLGNPGPIVSTAQTFKVVAMLTISYFVFSFCLQALSLEYAYDEIPRSISTTRFVAGLLFGVWTVYALCRVRRNMRARYQIKEERCIGCEGESLLFSFHSCKLRSVLNNLLFLPLDVCCSLWCGCCVTAQMLRHTGDYETYPGTCCSSSGHPPGTPITV